MSLATRVSAFFLAALAAVLGGFSVTLYLLARSHLHHDLDEAMTVALDALSAAALDRPGRVVWPRGARPALESAAHPGEGPVSWSVFDGRGALLDHSRTAGTGVEEFSGLVPMAPGTGHRHLPLTTADGRRWRAVVRQLRPDVDPDAPIRPGRRAGDGESDDDDRGDRDDRVPLPPEPGLPSAAAAAAAGPDDPTLVLVAAKPLGPVEARLRGVGLTLAGLSAGLWALAAAVGRRLTRRALDPVTRMAIAARAMDPRDRDRGQRLPSAGTGDELDDLAHSFNGLLGRMHEALARQARFTGDASHQLRTPLTALITEVEVARRRDRSSEQYRETLDAVHGDALRLRGVIESLLFLARADAEAALPDLQPVDLGDWLAGHLRGRAAGPRACDIVFTPPAAPVRARVHPPLLGELVDNLLDNACKYSPPGTPVTLTLSSQRGEALLAVEDRGAGIAPADLPHVFDPFYRSPTARLRGLPGVGLGLAVVRRVADAFGGTVTAANLPAGGTRLEVRLPDPLMPGTRTEGSSSAG